MDPGPSRHRRNSSSMGKPRESPGSPKKKGPKKERWLLTRKTWRYMADAGRKLIPDGHNKPEDIPKIEAYFQEVCNKEPKFLLWRKQSYPGAIGFRRGRSRGGRKKGGSVRDRTSSADEAEDLRSPQSGGSPQPSTSRFDLQKMREEFLFGRLQPGGQEREEEMLGTLERYLSQPRPGTLDTDKLIEKLKEHLASIEREGRERNVRHVEFEGDREETGLLDTLRRYYGKSTNRDKVISDLLTDRKKLEKLYFDMRKARNFHGRRGRGGGGGGASGGSSVSGSAIAGCSGLSNYKLPSKWHGRDWPNEYDEAEEDATTEDTGSTNPGSPTFVIEVEDPITTLGTQTKTISPQSWTVITEEIKKLKAAKEAEQEKEDKKLAGSSGPRRSSVDNDDVSPSVSDTIKRYLRMARKKSVDSDKADRFKRVNYDRNLRNIKGKGEPSISEDDGLDKGAQTDEVWIEALRDLKIDTIEVESGLNSSRSSLTEEPISPTSPTTKSFLSSGQTFLSNLLHGLQDKSVSAGGMQKSKSSTSVVQQGSRLVSKKIWKTARSKSQSRATPSATSVWTPQGHCVWNNVAGRTVTLTDTTLQQLTEIERKILQKVALAKLQALNLGVNIRVPSESPASAQVQKPKRKPYLLKRKAMTTGLFDTSRKELKDKGGGEGGGLVFGIPLSQCVENERGRLSLRQEPEEAELRRKSRGSFSSLIETNRPDEKGSCESLIGGTLSMPGLDNLSCGSRLDLAAPEGGVPTIVTSCLRYLQNHGLHTLGIFRVSSSKKRVRQLREDFDCGKEINLEDDDILFPHDVATLLKEYFRDLPDSLLCKDLYQAFIQTQRIRNRKLQHEAMQNLLQLLPVANRDTLLALLTFLSLVSIYSDDQRDSTGQWVEGNKMDSNNLATLFAPNILHSCSKSAPNKSDLSAERMEERSDAINVIRSLIDNHKSLYQVSAELLDDVYIHMMDSNPEALDQLLRRKDTSDDFDDSTSGTLDDAEKKYWSREACTHEAAATGGPDVSMRPRRLDRGRERISKKRRDESRRRGDSSESSSRRASDDKTRMSSSDSGHHTPDESNANDGIITASLKIPVPSTTSFSLNLDDIPYIEDSDRHQLSLGHIKSGGGGSQPESGVGSFSPPTRPPSVTSWGSTPTSPECEPTTATITFPSRHQPPQLQRVTITNTSQLQQVQPTSLRGELYGMDQRHYASSTYSRLLSSETKVSKSASSVAVPERHDRSSFTPSISSIGGAVLRSKTADIERMLRIKTSSKKTTNLDKDCIRRYTDTRHLTRNLVEEKGESSSSRSDSRGVWKRKEIISSEPKERRNLV